MLLASSGWRSGVLLKLLQCTGQLSTTKNYLAKNVTSAEVKRPCSRAFSLLPWTVVVTTEAALFKEGGKTLISQESAQGECGGAYSTYVGLL